MKILPFLIAAFLWSSEAVAQKEEVALTDPTEVVVPPSTSSEPTDPDCPEGKVCVSEQDMALILRVLRERKCLEETEPSFKFSSITIVVDEDGRIFYQGDPNDISSPFLLQMDWCHYQLMAGGPLKVHAAVQEPPVFGFRFRPKAYLGYALLTPFFDDNKFDSGIDAGLMLDFLHYKFVNLNATVGFRTMGAGVGVDISKNFGGYLGYGVMWKALLDPRQQPLHNFVLGVSFAF